MKEFINFYYGINVLDIKLLNEYYYFKYNNEDYYFIPFNEDEKRLNFYVKISNEIYSNNLKSHLIIHNKDNKIITSIDDVNYILMKIMVKNEEVSIIDVINNQKTIKKEINKNYFHWSDLWKMKIDFIENSLKEIKLDNIVKYSIDYYIGYAETSICYYQKTINSFYNEKYPLTWSHRRIFYPNMIINYLNPINYLYDYDVRDIAEYLKSCFFKDENDFYNEFDSFVKVYNFNNYNANLLFSRLLYPSYYFDIFEKWLNHKCTAEDMLIFIKKQKDYELFLKKAYQILSEYALMIPIDFIIS